MNNPTARGRNARSRGMKWMNEASKAILEATGLSLPRELREVRDGTRGDLELHPRIPHIYEAKFVQEPRIWSAMKQAQHSARRALRDNGRRLEPVVLLRLRTGSGRKHPRLALLPVLEWQRMSRLLVEHNLLDRPVQQRIMRGKAPNVLRGHREASDDLAHPDGIAVAVGLADKPRPQVALITFEDYLWALGALVQAEVW